MLVYGGATRLAAPADVLSALRAALEAVAAMPAGLQRHHALVAAFITAAELAQGLADAAFADAGRDDEDPVVEAAMAELTRLAGAVAASWCRGYADPAAAFDLPALRLPAEIRLRAAEGFAFYALYPEAYVEAAARSGLGPDTLVIGLRSIGTALAALVAATIGAPPPVTLRPVGHPWRRRLSLSEGLMRRLSRGRVFAVADEGPGLSGSSMGAVADVLEALGVPPDRVHFFPGHDGEPGPQASALHLRRWRAARRHVAGFDGLVPRASWMVDLTGPAEGEPRDISGGAWRALRYGSEADWPPVFAQQERRKFLCHAGGRCWLLRFAGLGREGERKAALARRLSAAGFVPAFAGFRHGFTAEAWLPQAIGLDRAVFPGLASWVGRYLAFRAGLDGPCLGGASLHDLTEMARQNIAEALGEAWAERLGEPPECTLRRVAIDGRMQPWEFLLLPSGQLVKSDAIDHHAAHDLIGAQDIAWDVAGAEFELGLDAEELCLALGGAGVDRALLAFYRPCYLAFHLGRSTMAAASCRNWPAEAARLDSDAARYAALLRVVLGPSR